MSEHHEGIHVVGVEAINFHRLKVAHVTLEPGGRFVRVTGNNSAGKTSLLRAVAAALGGAGEVRDRVVNDDAEDGTGRVRLELDNGFTVERRFTEAEPKGYLTVTGPDGGKHGQGKLNGWLGRLSFDPLAFFDLKPGRQRDVLLGLGTDPTLGDQLEALREEHARLYAERTPHIAEQRRARAVSKPEGERPEPVDVSGEMAKLRELQGAQREYQDVMRRVQAADERLQENDRQQVAASNRIREIEEELRRAEKALEDLKAKGERIAEERQEDMDLLGHMSPVDADIQAVHDRIAEADATNAALEPWKAWERAQVDLEAATAQVDDLTARMERMRTQERKLIAEAGIPVEGLSFDPESGEPLLNGRPLAVASGAERIRLAVSVAQAANPELRICLVDEANDLDLEQLQELGRLAEEHGFQVWGCRIGLEGPGDIVVEDGEARSAGAPEPAAEPAGVEF